MKFSRLLLTGLLLFIVKTGFTQDPLKLIEKMFATEARISSLQLTMMMNERIDGEYKKKKSFFKIDYNPMKIYMKQEYPNKGLEVLYIEGQNNNRAYISPKTFPWVTLSLNPLGKTMREDHHHPIFNSGYDYFINISKKLLEKHKHQINEVLSYKGIHKLEGINCHKIQYNSPDYKYFNYVVKKGETVNSIAHKFQVNEYMLIERNKGKIDYESVNAGSTISIPNEYAKKIIIYISAKNNLPYSIQAFDEQGLFQEYFYTDVVLNPNFAQKDFDVENRAYNF
ncbi:MAG: DUF1571 domain-containing protein [Bacteroidota bacterium]